MSDTLQAADTMGKTRYGYGGFWWRALALIIDAVIVSVVTGFASVLFLVIPVLLPLAPIIVDAAYSIFMESSQTQGTLGKMICRLKVADMQGQRISPGKAALRYVAKWLSTIFLLLGYLFVFFNKRKQAMHDMMAGTVVLRVQQDTTFADPIAGYHAQQYATSPQQMQPAQAQPQAMQPQPGAQIASDQAEPGAEGDRPADSQHPPPGQ